MMHPTSSNDDAGVDAGVSGSMRVSRTFIARLSFAKLLLKKRESKRYLELFCRITHLKGARCSSLTYPKEQNIWRTVLAVEDAYLRRFGSRKAWSRANVCAVTN